MQQRLAVHQHQARLRRPALHKIKRQSVAQFARIRNCKRVVAAQQVFAGQFVPWPDLVVGYRPMRIRHKIAVQPVHLVVSHASPAPRPRSSAQRAANRQLHPRMAACVHNLGARGFPNRSIDRVIAGFQNQHLAAQPIKLQRQGHAHGPRPNHAHVPGFVARSRLRNHHRPHGTKVWPAPCAGHFA